jgi:hypothetical protein
VSCLILLQWEEPLFQPDDDIPYIFPMNSHSKVVLQDPVTDQCLDIMVYHDSVELRMMEVFKKVDFKSFFSHAFMLITDEISCSKFQPTTFSHAFTTKYIKAPFRHRVFLDWFPWKVEFVDLSCLIDHLATWLHWSFEYVDVIMATLR